MLSGPARIEGAQLIFTGGGPVNIRAQQAGDLFYLPLLQEWAIHVTVPNLGVRLVGVDLELYWSASLIGFKLQRAESLTSDTSWQDVTTRPIEANSEAIVRLGLMGPQSYFRLFKP